MNFTIAEAREELLPRIQRIEQASFSLPWTEAMLRIQLDRNSHIFLTAQAGGRIVGYIGLMYVLDEGYISNVATDPSCRRQGIADALIGRLCAICGELRLSFVSLEVRAGNAPAIALYQKHGFAPVGLRKNYYERPREDAVIMTIFF